VTRVVVHIGAPRTGADAIDRGLFTNLDVLARQAVLVPETGRHDRSPQAVRHHLLPWSLDDSPGHPVDRGVWDLLAREIEHSGADTAILSSAQFARLAADPGLAPVLRERLRGLADDVTVVLFVGEQLSTLNSLYCTRVRTFEVTSDFDTYLDQTTDAQLCDLGSLRSWYDDGRIPFVAVPWDPYGKADALAALLTATGVAIDAAELRPAPDTFGDELGPIGIEATRLLGANLRGRFPDFSWDEPAARRLRRRSATAVLGHGWFAGQFWGWSRQRADQTVAHYADSNQEFARHCWGQDWQLPAPLDRPRQVADLVELDPEELNRVHRFVNEMSRIFPRLRATRDTT
jgi:hypothetical protein